MAIYPETVSFNQDLSAAPAMDPTIVAPVEPIVVTVGTVPASVPGVPTEAAMPVVAPIVYPALDGNGNPII